MQIQICSPAETRGLLEDRVWCETLVCRLAGSKVHSLSVCLYTHSHMDPLITGYALGTFQSTTELLKWIATTIKTIHLCKAQKKHFSHLLGPGEKILGRILPFSGTCGRIKSNLKTLSSTFILLLLSERVASENLRNGIFFSLLLCLWSVLPELPHSISPQNIC